MFISYRIVLWNETKTYKIWCEHGLSHLIHFVIKLALHYQISDAEESSILLKNKVLKEVPKISAINKKQNILMLVAILVRKKNMARRTQNRRIALSFCGPRIQVKQERECWIIEVKAKTKTTKITTTITTKRTNKIDENL